MHFSHIEKAYKSPEDEFLYRFDRKHKKSASQLKEIKKHQRIAELRDRAVQDEKSDEIWEEF